MNILFVSRKKSTDIGGLSRFSTELVSRFPHPHHLLTLPQPSSYFRIPYGKIDLIHLCDATLFPLGVFLKSIIHRPLTVTAHGLDICYANPVYQKLLRLASPKAHAFILDSSPVKNLLKNVPINIKRTYIINPGISVDHLVLSGGSRGRVPDSAESESSIPFFSPPFGGSKKVSSLSSRRALAGRKRLTESDKNKIKLLTVGNLVPRKGHVWFIKNVFTKLANRFTYLIVGEGPERSHIQSIINNYQLDDRIFLLGQVTNQQLALIYRQSDIYICPNQKHSGNFEGFGIAAGEATAMGLPVIASDVDGISELIINGKNGLLVKPNSAEFVQSINRLNNKELRDKIGKYARIFTRSNFNWDKTIRQYADVFQEVISNTPLLP